jgi:hypothetical protein
MLTLSPQEYLLVTNLKVACYMLKASAVSRYPLIAVALQVVEASNSNLSSKLRTYMATALKLSYPPQGRTNELVKDCYTNL